MTGAGVADRLRGMKRRRTMVIYDGECGFCLRLMQVLRRLDWFGRLDLRPATEAEEGLAGMGVTLGVTREALGEAVHCVTASGRVCRGVDCLRRAGLRTPLLAPLALLLWIPGVSWVADRVYARVSRNRRWLGRWLGCETGCGRGGPGPDAGSGRNHCGRANGGAIWH